MESLNFKLEVFEGPLDLLLTLISKNKVDISDIPIALILEQYLAAIEEMRSVDVEVSGDFIVMASELMLIKSRMLLPRNENAPEEDPRAPLVQALKEYKLAKEHALLLKERYAYFAARIVKDTRVIDTSHDTPEGLDVLLLSRAMNKILDRNRNLPRLAQESEQAIRRLLEARVVPVSECIDAVVDRLSCEGTRSLSDFLFACTCRSELIATFLALLELIRAQRVKVTWPSAESNDAADENAEEDVLFTLRPLPLESEAEALPKEPERSPIE